MLAPAVTFDEVILALHIMSVVVAFGVVFAWPIVMAVGSRLDARAMPWFHRIQQLVGRWIVSPGLLLVVVFGVILASEYHAWKLFYVQWGIGAAIVIGALEGMFLIPRAGRLALLAERDLHSVPAGAPAPDAGPLSAEYHGVARQLMIGTLLVSAIVLVTIYLMAVQAGA